MDDVCESETSDMEEEEPSGLVPSSTSSDKGEIKTNLVHESNSQVNEHHFTSTTNTSLFEIEKSSTTTEYKKVETTTRIVMQSDSVKIAEPEVPEEAAQGIKPTEKPCGDAEENMDVIEADSIMKDKPEVPKICEEEATQGIEPTEEPCGETEGNTDVIEADSVEIWAPEVIEEGAQGIKPTEQPCEDAEGKKRDIFLIDAIPVKEGNTETVVFDVLERDNKLTVEENITQGLEQETPEEQNTHEDAVDQASEQENSLQNEVAKTSIVSTEPEVENDEQEVEKENVSREKEDAEETSLPEARKKIESFPLKIPSNPPKKTDSSSSPTKVLGVEFVPLHVPLNRRLQTLAVLQWWLSILVMPIVCVILFFYILLFTRYWLIPVLYASWILVYDRNTPKRGGRRLQWLREARVWRYYRDYFPITLKKTADLDPQHNYIIGYHPHGIIGCGAFCNFATEATGFSKQFPGIKPYLLTLGVQFAWPFLRGYILFCGICDVSRESISWVTTQNGKGNAAIIVIGGAEEALEAHPGSYNLTLKNRKGFCRMALRTGSYLVPCYSFGENDLFKQADNPVGSRTRKFQEFFKNWMGCSPPFVYGRGVFNYTFGLMPFRKPVTTVVGRPIPVTKIEDPTGAEISQLHETYMEELSRLFDEHKEQHGIDKDKTITFI